VAKIGVEGKALLVDSLENTNAVLASRNNPTLQFVDPQNVNVYDVVNKPLHRPESGCSRPADGVLQS